MDYKFDGDEIIETKKSGSVENIINVDNNNTTDVNTLSVDQLLLTLRVIADLKPKTKLKIVNGTHLAEDGSYFNSFTRYNTEQCRDNIITFLEKMRDEVEKHAYIMLNDIRNKNDINNNIYALQNLIYKVSAFLHNYETMRSVYADDSDAYARLGTNRDKFFMFLNTFFRDMTTYNIY